MQSPPIIGIGRLHLNESRLVFACHPTAEVLTLIWTLSASSLSVQALPSACVLTCKANTSLLTQVEKSSPVLRFNAACVYEGCSCSAAQLTIRALNW